ncbi:MAG: hypothetical protein Q9173_002740 [Seirophora scorigena]
MKEGRIKASLFDEENKWCKGDLPDAFNARVCRNECTTLAVNAGKSDGRTVAPWSPEEGIQKGLDQQEDEEKRTQVPDDAAVKSEARSSGVGALAALGPLPGSVLSIISPSNRAPARCNLASGSLESQIPQTKNPPDL